MKTLKILSLIGVCLSLWSCHSDNTSTQSASQEGNTNDQFANPIPKLPPLKSFSQKAISTEILSPAPNFQQMAAGAERKQAFFNFLTPLVFYANQQILDDRNHMLKLFKQKTTLTTSETQWLSQLAEHYKITPFDPTQLQDRIKLKKRVDMVPIALALAQAANETAWGTSRFAKQGNNYFGQWCYQPGCGLVPKQRSDDANHEVKRFEHPFFSVQGYLKNLNTHQSYQQLRQIRFQARQNNQIPSAIDMTKGLINYSARKEVYVKALQHMIRYNKLTRFNQYTITKDAPH